MSSTLTRQSDVVATSVARNISQFRSSVSESFVPLQVTSPLADSFRGMIKAASIDEVHVTDVRATEHVVERTPELIGRADKSYFKLSLMLERHGPSHPGRPRSRAPARRSRGLRHEPPVFFGLRCGFPHDGRDVPQAPRRSAPRDDGPADCGAHLGARGPRRDDRALPHAARGQPRAALGRHGCAPHPERDGPRHHACSPTNSTSTRPRTTRTVLSCSASTRTSTATSPQPT